MQRIFGFLYVLWMIGFVLMLLNFNKKGYSKYQAVTVMLVIAQWVVILIQVLWGNFID